MVRIASAKKAVLLAAAALCVSNQPSTAQFSPTTPVWVQLVSGISSRFSPTAPSWVTIGAIGGVGISFVNVGDAGNNAYDGFGGVDYRFRISRYEVTNRQYTIFLNAVASKVHPTLGVADPYGLYTDLMDTDPRGGITRTGTAPGPYTYATKPNMENKPVNYVSWMDAARFCNWLHNGQSTDPDSTEKGSYELDGNAVTGFLTRETRARYWITNRNEWFKAAYYKGRSLTAGYWSYPTKSNEPPVPVKANATGNGIPANRGNSGNLSSEADWNDQNGNVTTVGRNGGPSAYGTYDQGGNVWELAEDSDSNTVYLLGSTWLYGPEFTEAKRGGWDNWVGVGGTAYESARAGFRVGAR